jgi:hypothetical protein
VTSLAVIRWQTPLLALGAQWPQEGVDYGEA